MNFKNPKLSSDRKNKEGLPGADVCVKEMEVPRIEASSKITRILVAI